MIALCGHTVSAEQGGPAAVSAWLHSSESHRTYLPVEAELTAIFREADTLLLPRELLISRLNLAAARKLPPPVLVRGMRGELERLRSASEIVAATFGAEGQAPGEGGRTELINALSIYLAGGLSREYLSSFLAGALQNQVPREAIFKACAAALRLSSVQNLSDQELLSFSQALVDSKVPPAGYGAISSFIVRAWSMGGEGHHLLASTVRILRQGGGLPQLELQLGRRR